MGIRVYKKEILYIYMHIHICTHTTHTHIFPGGSLVKNLPANAEDTGLSVDLENPLDGGAWRVTVHGAIKSWTWLSNWTYVQCIYIYIYIYIYALRECYPLTVENVTSDTVWGPAPRQRHFREADPGFCSLLQRKMHASFKEKLVSVENRYSRMMMNRLVFMVALPIPQKVRTEEYKESMI